MSTCASPGPVHAWLVRIIGEIAFDDADAAGLLNAVPREWIRGLPNNMFALISGYGPDQDRWENPEIQAWVSRVTGMTWAKFSSDWVLSEWGLYLESPSVNVWFADAHPAFAVDHIIADAMLFDALGDVTVAALVTLVGERVQSMELPQRYLDTKVNLSSEERARIGAALAPTLGMLGEAAAGCEDATPFRGSVGLNGKGGYEPDIRGLRLMETMGETGLLDLEKVHAYRLLGMSPRMIRRWESGANGPIPVLGDLKMLYALQ